MRCPDPTHTERLEPFYSFGEVDFRLCRQCGLLIRERMPSTAELEQIYSDAFAASKINDLTTEQESGEFAIGAYAAFLARRYIREGSRVLDYGAAAGGLVALGSSGAPELEAAGDGGIVSAMTNPIQRMRIRVIPRCWKINRPRPGVRITGSLIAPKSPTGAGTLPLNCTPPTKPLASGALIVNS